MNPFEISAIAQQLLRGLAFLGLASVIVFLLPRGPIRYVFWRGVFVLLLAMGIAGLGPGLRTIEFGFESTAEVVIPAPPPSRIQPDAQPAPILWRVPAAAEPIAMARPADRNRIGQLLVWIWIAGVFLILSRQLGARIFVRGMIRRAKPKTFFGQRVLISEEVATPCAAGLFKPRILVPSGFENWPASDQRIAIQHEIAHVQCRDEIWRVLATFAAALHWPNPLAWLGLRRMNQEREVSADASVVRSGVEPEAYAELLVRLATSARTPAAAVPMARKSTVPMRVDRVLAPDSGKAAPGPLLWLSLGLLAGVALTLGVTSILAKKDEPDPVRIRTVFVEPEEPAEIVGEGEFLTKTYAGFPFGILRNGDEIELDRLREVLENHGVPFPEGATVVGNLGTRQLILRNTPENHQLAETAIASLVEGLKWSRVQVYLNCRVVVGPAQGRKALTEILGPGPEQAGLESVSGVLTDPQFQVALRALAQQADVDLLSCPSIMAKSGQRASVEIEGLIFLGVRATIGADRHTLDLEFFNQEGEHPSTAVTIWDGQTLVLEERLSDGGFKMKFITATMVDPAGERIDREDPIPNPN